MDNLIEITEGNKSFIIKKYDTLKTLLTYDRILALSTSTWKTLLERKNGECALDSLKTVLKAKIKQYDTSKAVNGFIYNDKEYWFDKATRVGLQNLVNSNPEYISLVLEDQIVELSNDKAKEFLSQLEVYAGNCFVNTSKHLLAIKELKTVGDVVNYDYTSGYPNKIELNG